MSYEPGMHLTCKELRQLLEEIRGQRDSMPSRAEILEVMRRKKCRI